jgi:ketosteroid isomerase-like protein
MGRTRERAVCACDVVWMRNGSDARRRRRTPGPRKAPRKIGPTAFPNPWCAECSGGAVAGMEAVGALPGVPRDTANM